MSNKENNKLQGVRELAGYSDGFKRSLVIVAILALVGAVFILMGPKQIETITNLIVEGMETGIDIKRISQIGFFQYLSLMAKN